MTPDDLPELWLFTKAIWGNFALPASELEAAAMASAWTTLLGEFSLDTIHISITRLSAREFPPTVGQLRAECALAILNANGEATAPDLDQAWDEVKRTVGLVGRDGTPEWSHPSIAEAMRAFGWLEFCNSTDPEGVVRGQFRQFYEAASARFERLLVGTTSLELEYRREALEARVPALPTGPQRVLASNPLPD